MFSLGVYPCFPIQKNFKLQMSPYTYFKFVQMEAKSKLKDAESQVWSCWADEAVLWVSL